MKKLLLVLVAVIGLTFAANAQNIGARVKVSADVLNPAATFSNYGVEFSYQHYLGSNRIELDAGYSNGQYINGAAAYHWTFPIAGEFGWFIGPCVNVGYCINHKLGLAVGAQGGAEWNPSNLPLQFSVDARPLYDFILDENCAYKGFGVGVGVGVRYKLNH